MQNATLHRHLAALAVLTALSLTSAQADAAAARPSKIATVEGITEYAYPNGFKLLLFPDASRSTFTVNLTVFVGSRHEGYGEKGMAHLLEHLLFKGTPKLPNPTQALTERGARANGTTSYDRTNYFETLNASPENLDWAIRFEADRFVNANVSRKDLETEMTVVRNEFERKENNPLSILDLRTRSTAYLWHNYGQAVIGSRSDIESVPIERLQAFYKAYYRPDNAVLIVAGRFDERQALQVATQTFGRLKRPTTPLKVTYTREPVQDGEREVTLRRVGGTQALMAVYHVPAGAHEDFAAIDVLSEVLGDTPSGRLHVALVQKKLATSVGAWARPMREPGLLSFSAELPKDLPLADTQRVFLETIERSTQKAPTEEEVTRAREGLLKNLDLLMKDPERVGRVLSDSAASGDWRLFFIHRDRLRAVKPDDVLRVARTYLKRSNRTLGTFVPTEAPDRVDIPPAPDLAALVKDYKGDPALAQGEAFDSSPANIDKRSLRHALPGGMSLVLLPKKNRGESVHGTLTLRLGSEESLRGLGLTGDLTVQMLIRGTKKRTRQQIQDELDRLRARLSVRGGPDAVSASFETTRERLGEVVTLVAEILREPRFDAREFEELRAQLLSRIEEGRFEPSQVANVAYSRHIRPRPADHPHYVMTPDESIAAVRALELDSLKAFHQRFYGAQDGDLALVGDFDAEAAVALLTRAFDSWRAKEPFTRISSPLQKVAPASLSIETPDKANAFFLTGMTFALRDDHPDYPALLLGNYMLGGGFLSSRLAMRLRQQDGLSYSVSSHLWAHPIEENASFSGQAIYAPQNAGRVEAALTEELSRVLQKGFGEDEVAKARRGYLESRQVSRAQDGALASTLSYYSYLDRTFEHDARLDAKLAKLTAKEIQQAMARHLSVAALTSVKAGDFVSPPPPADPGEHTGTRDALP